MRPRLPDSLSDEAAALARLAWPVVLGQLGFMMLHVVDLVLVGHLGERPLAALALGTTWSIGVSIVVLGAANGLDPLFAQAFGANDVRAAGRALWQGAALLLLLAAPVAGLHLATEAGLRLLGQPEELLAEAGQYGRILAVSAPAMVLFGPLRQFLQGAGRMKAGTWAILGGNLANLALAWALVYGKFGLPALGIAGAAWATAASRYLMVAILAAFSVDLVRASWPERIRETLAPRALLEIGRIAGPVGVQAGLEVWAFSATTMWMGHFGSTAVAAHMVALNLASISFMVPFGISAAAATRVGNLLGAGVAWQRAGYVAVASGAAVMSISALSFALFPTTLAGLYSSDAAVLALAAQLLPLASMFQLFDGTQAVSFGVLRGAGDTRMPMIANLIGYWVIGLPAGYLLAFHGDFGPHGLWAGLAVGLATVSALLLARLRWTAARGGFRVVGA